tara:strand:+ start:374 stop:616 length:243 start_codon:yes stop_codon:yes gene_type:complete
MSTRRVKFTFPQDMVKRPIIYELSKKYEIVTNIRRADVRDDMGWVILELEGKEDMIIESLKWVVSTGVRVDPIAGDVIEG